MIEDIWNTFKNSFQSDLDEACNKSVIKV